MLEIETKRLTLRKWCLSDSKDLFEYARSELVGPNAGWQSHKNEDESKKIIEMFINDNDVLAIELKSEDKVIGSIGFHDRKPDQNNNSSKQCEIGFVLNPKYWGNGFIPESVNKLLDMGFNEMGMEYIFHELQISQLGDKFTDKGKDPMDLARRMLKDYTRGLFIDTGVGDQADLMKRATLISEEFDFRLERTCGSLQLLEDTLKKTLDSMKSNKLP